MYVDYNIAMNYLSNNNNIFKKIIASFVKSYKVLDESSMEALYRNIHNIKGISLNMGCVKLYEASIEVLPLIQQGFINEIKLNDYKIILNETISELLNYL